MPINPAIAERVQSYTIAERLERLPLTKYQNKLFIIIATAFFFDCVDIAMMTFALGPIKTEFGLNVAQTGMLGSVTFIGMFFGAAAAGILADRFGRCRVFQWSMMLWGLGSLLCAFAPNLQFLMACRILLGTGMAMEPVAGQALLCEFIPANQRGKYMSYLEGFWPLGFIAAALLSCIVLPIGGWRALFLAEAIPAIYVFFIRRNLPESPRWLSDNGQHKAANAIMDVFEANVQLAQDGLPLPEPKKLPKTSIIPLGGGAWKELWKPTLARRTAMLWCLWFFALLGFYGITTWLGALLAEKGFTIAKSNIYIACISLAGIPGFLTLSWLVESWGRKPSMIFTLIGAAVTAYLYGNANTLAQVIIFGFSMQFFMFGMWCALYACTPELYPTNLRATGCGFASASGRLGALLGPYIVGVILPIVGQSGVFQLGAGAFIMAALVMLILGEETKGKVLEEI